MDTQILYLPFVNHKQKPIYVNIKIYDNKNAFLSFYYQEV